VERKDGTNGTFMLLATTDSDQLSYVDTAAPSTNFYFYRVKAINYAGQTAYSMTSGPPTIALSWPTNGAWFASGVTNTLTVTAADADGTLAKVQFFRDGRDFGSALTAPFNLSRNHHLPGTNTFYAIATDNAGNTRVSATPTVTVIQDTDGDGLTDAQELILGTSPFLTDSDADGVSDDLDAFPLDPNRWLSPSVNPDDHTAPTIFLLEPAATPQ
jgi:hypothetical protein